MQVFISYSREDQDFAARLCNDLILFGIEVWYDELSIPAGDSIPGAIQIGLSKSDCVLLIVSHHSVSSRWVIEELNSTLYSAISTGTPFVLPVLLDTCEIPPMIRHRKCINFSNADEYERNLSSLVTQLCERCKDVQSLSPALPGFRSVQSLGEGGFSTVYKATEARTGLIRAVKIPKGRRRLEPEASVLDLLKGHEGIVPIIRTEVFKGRTMLIMPYAGHSLRWHVQHGKIRPKQVAQITTWMKRVLSILAFAHDKHIVHCDIKPSNILIDEFGDLRIVDFGIAQRIHYAEFQRSTVVRGTLAYMAPEQQLGEAASARTDIYSVGALFFELLTGEKPVGRFRSPRYYNPDVSPQLEQVIERCLERSPNDRYASASEAASALNRALNVPSAAESHTRLVGKSNKLQDVVNQAKLVAQSDGPVIISGESGTGKELVAQLIFEEYARLRQPDAPFIKVNVAAIPDTLFEAQLFGYVRGAFSGAVRDRIGYFERAHGGVLFLDEIGELPLSSQAKLLSVLDGGVLTQVGSDKPKTVAVKVLAVTNQSLEKMVSESRFRADLFYRLQRYNIYVPALRERKEDIIPLAEHFLQRVSEEFKSRRVPRLGKAAIKLLEAHTWPGNVRELRNVIQRAVLEYAYADDTELQPSHLDLIDLERASRAVSDEPLSLAEVRRQAEVVALKDCLSYYGKDAQAAAKRLGISVPHFLKLMKRHGLM